MSAARAEAEGVQGCSLYAQQRWLDPTSGRFLSLDPVDGVASDPLSTQGFTYAHANPTRLTDPTGEFVALIAGIAKYVDNKFNDGRAGRAYEEALDKIAEVSPTTAAVAKSVNEVATYGSGVVEDALNGVSKIAEGEVLEGALDTTGMTPLVQQAAEADHRRQDQGQGVAGRARGVAGEVSGVDACMEGVLGENEFGESVRGARRASRGIQGCNQVLTTILGGFAARPTTRIGSSPAAQPSSQKAGGSQTRRSAPCQLRVE